MKLLTTSRSEHLLPMLRRERNPSEAKTLSLSTGLRPRFSRSGIREFSSGGVVFRGDLWFVRKTKSTSLYPKSYWMLPKGRIDDTDKDEAGPISSGKIRADETSLQNAAIRETREEGGIDVKIVKKIGTVKYSYKDPNRGAVIKFVTFYLMEWQKDLPEGFDSETSEVAWLPFDEAKERLSFSLEKETLTKAQKLLGGEGGI